MAKKTDNLPEENENQNVKEAKKKSGFSLSTLFKSNRFIFIISLIAAIALWVTVSPNRDMNIAVTVNIDLANTGVEKLGLQVISGQGQTVDVTVSGKWYVISELTDKDIKLSYSLGDVTKTGEYELSLSASKATTNSDYEITKINPEKINVSFDYIYTRPLKIEAKAPNIKAKEGFIADTPVIDTDYSVIDITGPKSIVEKISTVKAEVDTSATLDSAQSYTVPLKLYDSAGKEISTDSLTLPFTEVDVTVPINKSKTVPLKVNFTNVPEYYGKNPPSYTLSVDKLNIIGTAEVIDSTNEIVLGEIDFATIDKANNKFTFDLSLQSGISAVDDIKKVTCTINTSSLSSKSLDISTFTTVNNPDGKAVSVVTSKKAVTVVGPESVISSIQAADLYLEADLTDNADSTGEFMTNATLKSKKYNNIWGYGSYQIQVKVS